MLKGESRNPDEFTAQVRSYASAQVAESMRVTNAGLAVEVVARWPFDLSVLRTRAMGKTGIQTQGLGQFARTADRRRRRDP